MEEFLLSKFNLWSDNNSKRYLPTFLIDFYHNIILSGKYRWYVAIFLMTFVFICISLLLSLFWHKTSKDSLLEIVNSLALTSHRRHEIFIDNYFNKVILATALIQGKYQINDITLLNASRSNYQYLNNPNLIYETDQLLCSILQHSNDSYVDNYYHNINVFQIIGVDKITLIDKNHQNLITCYTLENQMNYLLATGNAVDNNHSQLHQYKVNEYNMRIKNSSTILESTIDWSIINEPIWKNLSRQHSSSNGRLYHNNNKRGWGNIVYDHQLNKTYIPFYEAIEYHNNTWITILQSLDDCSLLYSSSSNILEENNNEAISFIVNKQGYLLCSSDINQAMLNHQYQPILATDSTNDLIVYASNYILHQYDDNWLNIPHNETLNNIQLYNTDNDHYIITLSSFISASGLECICISLLTSHQFTYDLNIADLWAIILMGISLAASIILAYSVLKHLENISNKKKKKRRSSII